VISKEGDPFHHIIVFGGFVNGTRVNDIASLSYNKSEQSIQANTLSSNTSSKNFPIARAGHTHIEYREVDEQGN
jgi:hypothetical protein